ncbi:MAG: hypothetical protein LIO68_08305, partial [Rikenellaceae bacterium]|nr:hypothetical protein [Rikenellaceae bacterium]
PAFIAATKEMRIDRSLLAGMTGKDTSLLLTFPMEYQCVYDTINKDWPDMTPKPWGTLAIPTTSFVRDGGEAALQREVRVEGNIDTPYNPWAKYQDTKPTRIWYYLAFIKEQPE